MSDAEKRVVIPLGEQSKAQVLSRLAGSLGFIPLGGKSRFYPAWWQTQYLSRLAVSPVFISLDDEPSIYLAWRLPKTPAFISLGGCSRPQHLSRLAVVAKRGFEVVYSTMTRPRLPSIFTR